MTLAVKGKQQECLGVIGGMGPQATQLFLQGVINKTDATCDQQHIPMIILNHTTIPDRTRAILSGKEAELMDILLKDAKMLEQSGCTAIAIPCNTSHCFVDKIQKQIGIPIIHMVRETVNHLARAKPGLNKLAILATDGTIQAGVYQRECEDKGIRAYIPSPAKQALLMEIIYREIKQGKPGSLASFLEVEQEIKREGCDAAILACTELSCFARQYPLTGFYVDAMDILIDKTVQLYGKEKAK